MINQTTHALNNGEAEGEMRARLKTVEYYNREEVLAPKQKRVRTCLRSVARGRQRGEAQRRNRSLRGVVRISSRAFAPITTSQ